MSVFCRFKHITISMNIHTIEKARDGLEYVSGPVTARCGRSIHVEGMARHIGVEDIVDGIVGILCEGKVLSLGRFGCPALLRDIRLVLNFEIGHLVMVAHVEPVNGRKDMFPPFIPIGGRFGGIRCPAWLMLIITVAQHKDNPDMVRL